VNGPTKPAAPAIPPAWDTYMPKYAMPSGYELTPAAREHCRNVTPMPTDAQIFDQFRNCSWSNETMIEHGYLQKIGGPMQPIVKVTPMQAIEHYREAAKVVEDVEVRYHKVRDELANARKLLKERASCLASTIKGDGVTALVDLSGTVYVSGFEHGSNIEVIKAKVVS
jgi:hypothetical protein